MWRCRGLAYVVHDEFVTSLLKIGCHAGAHDSQSDESHLHVGFSWCAFVLLTILQRTRQAWLPTNFHRLFARKVALPLTAPLGIDLLSHARDAVCAFAGHFAHPDREAGNAYC